MSLDMKKNTPTIFNVTMTVASTEYSQALPAGTKSFTIHTQDETAFRIAFVTGKVATPTAPYFSIPVNKSYSETSLNLTGALTVYFGSANAGKIVEILCWTDEYKTVNAE